jgi:hypothetical protein
MQTFFSVGGQRGLGSVGVRPADDHTSPIFGTFDEIRRKLTYPERNLRLRILELTMMKLMNRVAALSVCLVLASAGLAAAQNPTQDAYSGVAGQQGQQAQAPSSEVVGATDASTTAPVAEAAISSDSGSTLPFTGLQLAFIGIAAIALLGVGTALFRSSRQAESQS